MTDAPRAVGTVTLTGLAKRYGTTRALDEVSLSVVPGEFFTLLGPSGCGKTTTLRSVAGFVTPDAGTVAINGAELVVPLGETVSVLIDWLGVGYYLCGHADQFAFGVYSGAATVSVYQPRIGLYPVGQVVFALDDAPIDGHGPSALLGIADDEQVIQQVD